MQKILREYLQSKINSNDDYHNTQGEWDQSMHNYFTGEMLNALNDRRETVKAGIILVKVEKDDTKRKKQKNQKKDIEKKQEREKER